MTCLKCGKVLDAYDVGFYKKLVNRGSEEFMCIPCVCDRFRMTEETAWNMIDRFRKSGCTLFPEFEEN